MYLHEDKENFKDIIEQVSNKNGRTPKVFALCDYYLQGKSKRYSRHLHDIYKLTSRMKFDDEFIILVNEIREHRAKMPNCPSAKTDANISSIIVEFCNNDFYKEDYQTITNYFVVDYISYEDAIKNILNLAELKLF